MNPSRFFLLSFNLVISILSTIDISEVVAYSVAEQAIMAQAMTRQVEQIKVIRKEGISVFKTLTPTLSDATAKPHADIIAVDPAGLSYSRQLGNIQLTIRRTGPNPQDVTATPTSYNAGGIQVYVGLLATLGIHTNPDLSGMSVDELSAIIPGFVKGVIDDTTGRPIYSIWDWAYMETKSLLESKPTTFLHPNTSSLRLSDARLVKVYLQRKYSGSSSASAAAASGLSSSRIDKIAQLIRSNPIASLFFTQLLAADELERFHFIQYIVDAVLPHGADRTNEDIAKDLTYPLFKHAFLSTLATRSLSDRK